MHYAKPIAGLFLTAMLASTGVIADETSTKDAHSHGGHHFRVEGSFGHADQNGDGKISRQEWFNESEHVFTRLDDNGNRHIDKSEFRSLPEVKSLP